MFKRSSNIISCLVTMLMVSSMILTSYAGGWDVSSASDWAKEEIEEAFSYDLVPSRVDEDFQNKITRAEFASLVVRLYEQLTDKSATSASKNTFTDTTDSDVLKAKGLGIINGRGDGTFDPNALVTRQEMAIMYYNSLNKSYGTLGETLKKTDGILTMKDKSQVASWASNYVDFVYENDIIKGNEGNFIPLGNATREQAIIVLKRVYEKYKVEKVVEIPKFKIEKDGDELEGLMNYGGYIDRGEDYLNIKYNSDSMGPLVLATDENNNLVKAASAGIYEAKFKFNSNQGNAGISFLVSSPRIGNCLYKGYFVGIDPVNNTVFIGKSNNDWNNFDSAKLKFDVKIGKYYDLKVVRNGSRIDIYVNDVKYISTSDNTYYSKGYFGPRLWNTNATYKYVGYDKDMGKLTPKNFAITNVDDDKLMSLKRYGGAWKLGETLTLIDNKYKLGPIVLPYNNKGSLEVFPASAIYEAKFNFKEFDGGNAGFIFNVSEPKVGNDQYKGYYAGVNWKDNSVMLGKANYNWTNLKEEKIPFSIANGKITLKVEKVFSSMAVYVNGKKIFTVSDSTYTNSGYFGARVWNTTAEYDYLKADKIPY